MPILSSKYLLEAFLDGDIYSANSDRRRFTTVDNQLNIMSDIIGDGRIAGWEIQDATFPNVVITSGSGLVDKYYINTFNDQTKEISENSTSYVYVQRRVGIIGTSGPKSDIASIKYIDDGPPSQPQSFTAETTESDPYFTVILSWTINTEIDLDHYEIERSTSATSNFVIISNVDKDDNIYEDSVDEDETYYYRLYAVDKSGNRSAAAEDNITTLLSPLLPGNPVSVEIQPSESAINILWKRPSATPFSKIDHWEVEYVRIKQNGDEVSNTKNNIIINKELYYDRINSLINGEYYKITLYTVDNKNRKSTGFTKNVIPQPNAAPMDPEGIAYEFTEGPSGVRISLSWTDGSTPYDNAVPYRYNIYVSVDGDGRESAAINVPIHKTEYRIDLYTFNLVDYFSVPENTMITLRLTSLDEAGHESFGNYVRFITPLFSIPSRLHNLQASFDIDTGKITVTWETQPDTNDIEIKIIDDDLNDPYVQQDIIVNERIGKTNIYIFDAELGHKYTIYVTPFNIDDVAGPPSIAVELTLVPGSFPKPDLPQELSANPNDREVRLSWRPSHSRRVKSYRIYKKEGNITVDFNDWSLLEEVPKDIFTFIDYGLDNDTVFSYYVTAIDIYNQESLHLLDGGVNLNFIESKPKKQGILTEPTNVRTQLHNGKVSLVWDSLLEEFDSFTIYRSINNQYTWTIVDTVDRDTLSYEDIELPLIDQTVFYYIVNKSINDADIVVQSTDTKPESSILIGKVQTNESSFVSIDQSDIREIKNMADAIAEHATSELLLHKHRSISQFDPDRIDLNPQLSVTNWTTRDGKIWNTSLIDISGSNYILKVNKKFPNTFFSIDTEQHRIIFSEPIVEVDDQTGEIIGDIPEIELQIMGVEEIEGVLSSNRFNNIHARQIAFGRINKDQMPAINHDGRIKEKLIPKRFLLERYSNHHFIIPESISEESKNFGDGTSFFSVAEADGLIDEIIDFDLYDDDSIVGFRKPSFSPDTVSNLKQHSNIYNIASGNNNSVEYKIKSSMMWMVASSGLDYKYYVINKTSGQTYLLNTTSSSSVGVAYDTVRNKLFNVTGDNKLSVIDLKFGTVSDYLTLSNFPSGTWEVLDITFSKSHSAIFAVAFDNTNGTHLFSINPDTAVITNIGQCHASIKFHGIAYDENNNKLYATSLTDSVSSTSEALWEINPSNANITKITTVGELGWETNALSYDTHVSTNESLYGIGTIDLTTPGNDFVSINKVSGLATLIRDDIVDSSFVTRSIESPPKDLSFWIQSVGDLAIGDFRAIQSDVYMQFALNIPKNTTIAEASVVFTAYDVSPSSGTLARFNVSVLDPSQYSSTINLSTESIKATPDLTEPILWQPNIWETNERSSNTTVDITTLVQSFIEQESYPSNNVIIIKIVPHNTIGENSNRIAHSFKNADKSPFLECSYVVDFAGTNSNPGGFQSEKSYNLQFEFEDNNSTRWVRVTTFDTENVPNPIIDLKKRLRFRILLESSSLYISLGIREIDNTIAIAGANGGTSGDIEWCGLSDIITNTDGNIAPLGKLIVGQVGTWQEVEFDIPSELIRNFDGDGFLTSSFGVLEHLAFTINPADDNATGPFNIYIDKIQQLTDVMVSGTSQGILLSRDFGVTWFLSRLTDTPVHKFYKAVNNRFLWAITGNEVLFATDPAFWFATSGTTGIQYIRDIVEDENGNMFISTDRGVYWLEIALILTFAEWRQTQIVNAFTTDCYGLYHNNLSSGMDEIWVSTEIGVFKTTDLGETWQDTGMKTGGLPAYKITNISDDISITNIIAINRKHVLRKLNNITDFEIISNLEEQAGINDIWTFNYFAGKLYLSTGDGVYTNTIDELFIPGNISVTFEKLLHDLDINSQVGIAFCLDVVQISKTEKQLFIGQENRLMVADETNKISIKERYNKEIPSFYINDNEIKIGYIYNSFNGVVVFREPQPVNKIISACYIPRRVYIAKNLGWSHNNATADVFIYVNGFPKWLDFKIDSNAIVTEISSIEKQLQTIQSDLDTFNSLFPQSSSLLTQCLNDINTILLGNTTDGSTGSPLINKDTIKQFINSYTQFISLLTETYKLENNLLDIPNILLIGFPKSDRSINSRSSLEESKYKFSANDSTNIIINSSTGSLDFTTVYQQTTDPLSKENFVFDKYDILEISIFNSNVDNTGTLSHNEIEDKMEDINTGLPSVLSKSHYTNLIKLGIFLESQNNFLFDRYPVSSIQSKYNAAYTNDWYDILNSTVDYEIIKSIPNHSSPRFVNVMKFLDNSPYFPHRLWMGTDADIIEYNLDTENGVLVNTNVIRPGNGASPLFIWDIFVHDNDEVYVTAEDKDAAETFVYLTRNSGTSWSKIDTINLPPSIYKFIIINGNKIAATSEGVFYSDNNFGTWTKPDVIPSDVLGLNHESLQLFRNKVFNIIKGTFLAVETNRYLFTSSSGLEWFSVGPSGKISNNELKVINKIIRYNNLTYIATDKGIYNDGNSILSDNVQFGLESSIESTSTLSSSVHITDITTGTDKLYCSGGNGKIYRYWDNPDDDTDGPVWSRYKVPDFDSIHKISLREDGDKQWLIVTFHNRAKVIDVTPSTGVFT